MRLVGIVLHGLVLVIALGRPALGAPPAWLRTAAVTTGPLESAAVVLLDQVDAVVAPDGKLRVTRRYAVRLRDRDGRDAASIREVYVTDGGKIRGMRGWLIRASGETRELEAANTAASRSSATTCSMRCGCAY